MKASRNVDNSLAAQKQQKDEGEGATAEAALVRGTAVVSVGGVAAGSQHHVLLVALFALVQ